MDGISANGCEEMKRQVGQWGMVVLCRQPLVRGLRGRNEWTGDEAPLNRLVEGYAACIGVQNSGVKDGSVQGAEN